MQLVEQQAMLEKLGAENERLKREMEKVKRGATSSKSNSSATAKMVLTDAPSEAIAWQPRDPVVHEHSPQQPLQKPL
ncbi:hypothetical protein MGG_17751 [Pyricularia oryzae 70-15]|uniref:Uncharacterized protein n=1 Tax=Pyricularia oryzae (strain 70-15 / ATCC MYA-4617 / FGSC 8958) TaxID=242507 RepID=G4NHL7_PYRO7|nr:uncharacterized protein MGG_17751 [Pyricularia oryzae 70-15]EHA47727.1 hypothetical protein MGG_17751 [Pyricularia oryzae 70-15]